MTKITSIHDLQVGDEVEVNTENSFSGPFEVVSVDPEHDAWGYKIPSGKHAGKTCRVWWNDDYEYIVTNRH